MKDAIIGAITKYTPESIEPWVNSIRTSGFKGGKFMLVYEVPIETIKYLHSENFIVFDCGSLDRPIVVRRFLDLYSLLTQDDFIYDRVIVTDVKDVIFQLNPSLWLDKNLKSPIVVGSESILSKDMEWAVKNYGDSYPLEWSRIKNKISFCAGVISGKTQPIADLFLNIFRWSLTGATPYQNPDQAALNVLMDMEPYKNYIQRTFHKDAWVAHLGVSLDKPELHGPFLQDNLPQIKGNLIVNSEGFPFTIIHQYDRILQLKEKIKERYKLKILPEPKSNDNAPGFLYKKWKQFKDFGKYDNSYNEMLKDKRVIIVGPSPSLEGKGMGEYIDSFDIVVRINKAFPVEKEMTKDIGTRTDIHYHCLCTEMHCGGPVFYQEMKEANVFVSCPYPKWVGPFYNDVARFENDNKKWDLGFHILNTHYYMNISEMLGTRANSGTLTILDLLCYDVKELHITGFTWFRDGWRKSYKDHTKIFGEEEGKRKEEKWLKGEFDGNHKQKPQEDLVREIYLNDDRVSIDDTMKQILEVK